MGFFSGKNHSAGYARDRMKLLLVSERIDCSPQMMKLLRNDLIHAVKKYVVIYKTMSSQLSETFTKQERAMKDAIKEIDEMQSSYMKTADRIIRDNQMIQQLQKQDYEKFARHMHENEKESADLWKNCNASMRQYVDSAAEGMKAVADSNRISEELLREDKKMIEDFEARVKELPEPCSSPCSSRRTDRGDF